MMQIVSVGEWKNWFLISYGNLAADNTTLDLFAAIVV